MHSSIVPSNLPAEVVRITMASQQARLSLAVLHEQLDDVRAAVAGLVARAALPEWLPALPERLSHLKLCQR